MTSRPLSTFAADAKRFGQRIAAQSIGYGNKTRVGEEEHRQSDKEKNNPADASGVDEGPAPPYSPPAGLGPSYEKPPTAPMAQPPAYSQAREPDQEADEDDNDPYDDDHGEESDDTSLKLIDVRVDKGGLHSIGHRRRALADRLNVFDLMSDLVTEENLPSSEDDDDSEDEAKPDEVDAEDDRRAGAASSEGDEDNEEGEEDDDRERDEEMERAAAARVAGIGSYVSKNTTWYDRLTEPLVETLPLFDDAKDAGPNINPLFPVDSFLAFVTEGMIEEICRCTNIRASQTYQRSRRKERFVCDPLEMKAFLGLLLLMGVQKSNRVSYEQLWDQKYGMAVCHGTMSLSRFKNFLRHIRFDSGERDKRDKLAPIRRLWEDLNSNLEHNYCPSANLTVDEQLIPFKGRVPFKQYMPSKPGKYGMKVFWMCDARNFYPMKGLPYLGRPKPDFTQAEQDGTGSGEKATQRRPFTKSPGLTALDTVWELTEPVAFSGRNITTDNYFTSKELARLLYEERQLTLVGTVRSNKRCLPHEFKNSPTRVADSHLFGFNSYMTLVSHVPAKNKSVALLSTKHHEARVDGQSGKPLPILFYNETKCGVDVFDQLVRTYTCKRTTRRWPFAFFMNMLDAAAVASLVIWQHRNPEWNRAIKHRRRLFLAEIGEQLVRPFIVLKAITGTGLKGANRAALSVAGFKDCFPNDEPHRVAREERDDGDNYDYEDDDAEDNSEDREQGMTGCVRVLPAYRKRRVCSVCPVGEKKRQRQYCCSCLNSVCDEHCQKTVKCHRCLGVNRPQRP